MKKVQRIYNAPAAHWVGDGFPVRSLFSYDQDAVQLSPFLLLDYAGPATFKPSTSGIPRGVGIHPHKGFETVTIVYKGEVEHHDSTDQGGVIGPGDVQWMTAGSGILHQEYHSPAFNKSGGELEMVQLWVNLPAKAKLAKPGYQGITAAQIPSRQLANDAGVIRVIAGEFETLKGPATTFTPMNVWDVRLNKGGDFNVAYTEGWTTAIMVLRGSVEVNGETTLGPAQMALMETKDSYVSVKASEDSVILVLNGEPIDEPVVGRGPFVMNTVDEINQAFSDFRTGNFIKKPTA